MILQGKKVRLRPFKSDDYQVTAIWRQDSDLRMLAQFHSFPVTEELESEWLKSILVSKSDKTIYFAVEEIEGDSLIGYFQLKNINWISRVAWLGIIIGEKAVRGRGYGKEIMDIGLNYAFNYLNIRKISLEVLSENIPAISLYNKIGFLEEGNMKKYFYFNGKYYDVKILSLIK